MPAPLVYTSRQTPFFFVVSRPSFGGALLQSFGSVKQAALSAWSVYCKEKRDTSYTRPEI